MDPRWKTAESAPVTATDPERMRQMAVKRMKDDYWQDFVYMHRTLDAAAEVLETMASRLEGNLGIDTKMTKSVFADAEKLAKAMKAEAVRIRKFRTDGLKAQIIFAK